MSGNDRAGSVHSDVYLRLRAGVAELLLTMTYHLKVVTTHTLTIQPTSFTITPLASFHFRERLS